MNKKEFLSGLEQALAVLQDEELRDILDEYEQHIDMKMKNGLSEAEAIADFGDFRELTADILEAYHVRTDYASIKGRGPGGDADAFGGFGAPADGNGVRSLGEPLAEAAGKAGGRQTDGGSAAGHGSSSRQEAGVRMMGAAEHGEKEKGAVRRLTGTLGSFCAKAGHGLGSFLSWTWRKAALAASWLWRTAETAVVWSWERSCALAKWCWKALAALAGWSLVLLRGAGRWSVRALRWLWRQLCRPVAWLTGKRAGGPPESLRAEAAERIGCAPPGAAYKKGRTERGNMEMEAKRSPLGGLWRGIAAIGRWCAEAAVWCVRLFWNMGCICGVLLVGLFGMFGLFSLGVLTVLLLDGYPLLGVTLACLGVTVSIFALALFGLTLLWRGKKKTAEAAESGPEIRERKRRFVKKKEETQPSYGNVRREEMLEPEERYTEKPPAPWQGELPQENDSAGEPDERPAEKDAFGKKERSESFSGADAFPEAGSDPERDGAERKEAEEHA